MSLNAQLLQFYLLHQKIGKKRNFNIDQTLEADQDFLNILIIDKHKLLMD